MLAGQVGGDLRARQLLTHRELERQCRVELVQQAAVDRRPRLRGVLGGRPPALRQQHLQLEGLIPLQALFGPVLVGVVDGPVDAAQGVRVADQAMALPHRPRQRVIRHVQDVQDDLDRIRDLPGLHLAGCPVHRDELGGKLGGPGPGAPRSQQLVFGVGELALAAEAGDLAREEPARPRRELMLAPGLRAPAEECQRQPAVAVGHDGLHDEAAPVLHPPAMHGQDLGLDRDVVALAQPDQVGQLAALVVPPGVVSEQITDGIDVERREPLGRLVPDDQPERIGVNCHVARIG